MYSIHDDIFYSFKSKLTYVYVGLQTWKLLNQMTKNFTPIFIETKEVYFAFYTQ